MRMQEMQGLNAVRGYSRLKIHLYCVSASLKVGY